MLPEFEIAVVEDDEDIRNNVCRYLEKTGFRAWSAESTEDFYVQLLRKRADLVVVDIGLPGEDGLSLVRRLSEMGIAAVLMTARAEVESRILGLNSGALQYFVKPVDMEELVAGIRSQLRRGVSQLARPALAPAWRLDRSRARLIAPNQEAVELTSRELELLGCLMAQQGALVTKQDLTEAVGADAAEDGFHRVESQLTRLRRKTLEATRLALPVRSVFGRGLVFVG
ncbi:response regulator transcription factor [Acidovorax sp. FG27]|uniref:response regulator transcription factor n=1 Tax=Acidovorax sp. FG27 TaxID=3133652 RepID=UPI0030EA42B3